jgi:hypothetical protein
MMRFWRSRFLKPVSVAPGLAASMALHGAIIAASVIVTTPNPDAPPPELPPNSIARFLAPPNRAAGQAPQREHIRFIPLIIPEGSILVPPKVAVVQAAEPSMTGLDQVDAPALEELTGMDSVFSLIEVDSAASRYEWSAAPTYPPAMLAARQGGYVRAEWVVDESGIADTTTLRVVEFTHPDFVKAVREALPFMRFRPARIGSRAVRQLVQQPFYFQVTTAQADTAKTRKPIL